MNDKKPQYLPPAGPRFDWRYYVWLLVLVLLTAYWVQTARQPAVEALSYSAFKQAVRDNRVAEVTLRGQEVIGTYREVDRSLDPTTEQAQSEPTQRFSTTLPPLEDRSLMDLLEQHGVTVHAESSEGPWWAVALISVLPWVLLIGLIWWGTRKMQERMLGGGKDGGLFGFSKSPAKRFREGTTEVSFDDVAGLENAKRDLQEIIEYLKNPERFRTLGAKIPKGILLVGAPGTGKTLAARAVAGEAGVPFYNVSGSEFIEMFVGVGAARVRDMFKSAKAEAPAIIFIDEIDSVGRARGTGLGGGHDEREQTLNQILNEMDGFAPHESVVVMAATNRPDVLDPALQRPGRFDRKIVLELPGKNARQAILQVHSRGVPMADDVDLEATAKKTVGFSGADLENLINEAALLAGRENQEAVDMALLDAARDKIVLGAERESILGDEERKLVAYHESGHALLAWLLPNADPLDKVTIVPRGRALGATEQTQEEDRYNVRRSYLLDRIAVMLGGRVAEKVVFGDVSSGSEADLRQATQLARRMVCQWGMSEELGAVSFRSGEEHIFLGREMTQSRDFSEHSARQIDDEIRTLIGERERKAEELLTQNRESLDTLAQKLLEEETLNAAEITELLEPASAA